MYHVHFNAKFAHKVKSLLVPQLCMNTDRKGLVAIWPYITAVETCPLHMHHAVLSFHYMYVIRATFTNTTMLQL